MDIRSAVHNIMEDIVVAQAEKLLDGIAEEYPNLNVSDRCRLDTICYVLNRIAPYYTVSDRGVIRFEQASIEQQQKAADITALIYEGIRQVNHNQRRKAAPEEEEEEKLDPSIPVFNFPIIVGRLFNGLNFSPISNVTVELRGGGKLVRMNDANWQNPYTLVANTQGTFTFWPKALPAREAGLKENMEFSIEIEAPGFEPFRNVFSVPVSSETQKAGAFSLDNPFRLPDLYMFPPGGDEEV